MPTRLAPQQTRVGDLLQHYDEVLLANLQSCGLRTDRNLLVILDGAKMLRKAVRDLFGDSVLV